MSDRREDDPPFAKLFDVRQTGVPAVLLNLLCYLLLLWGVVEISYQVLETAVDIADLAVCYTTGAEDTP